MKIYKFGGASVKSATGVINLAKILKQETDDIVVVISAMGKMTNAFEKVTNSFYNGLPDLKKNTEVVIQFHQTIISELFKELDSTLITQLFKKRIKELEDILSESPSLSYDYEYDKIVCYGELLSTTIVSSYLIAIGIDAQFVDIRKALKTDDNFREANVDLQLSQKIIPTHFPAHKGKTYITQGFLAGTKTNQTTTLGREGSDYSAAILANLLEAESVTIWKDVPGVMNADPKRYNDVEIIPKLSYKEAIELSYCGASVIHPKTVKPLQNKRIPLHVKSFLQPKETGSVINDFAFHIDLPPIYINKTNQVLLTLTPRDFSFIAEEKLSQIYALLAKYRVKASLIQTSAISFSICADYNAVTFSAMIDEMMIEYEALYNSDVELITIRHYTKDIVDQLVGERVVYVEQRNRLTARFVVPAS